MIEERDSLVKREAQQLAFPLSVETVEAAARAGEFTGELLFSRDPQKYHEIIAMTAEGMGVHRIARVLKVSGNTVRAVRAREGLAIATGKREMAQRCREVARMGVDRIHEEIDDMDIDKLPVAIGILIDKSLVLDGEPSLIVEHREVATLEDFERALSTLPCVDAEVIEDDGAPGMGIEGGECGNGAPAVPAGAGAGGPPAAVDLGGEGGPERGCTDE